MTNWVGGGTVRDRNGEVEWVDIDDKAAEQLVAQAKLQTQWLQTIGRLMVLFASLAAVGLVVWLIVLIA